MTEAAAQIKFSATAKVSCPSCGKVHYEGPAMTPDFSEPVAIGDRFVCSHCQTPVVITGESL